MKNAEIKMSVDETGNYEGAIQGSAFGVMNCMLATIKAVMQQTKPGKEKEFAKKMKAEIDRIADVIVEARNEDVND